MRPVFKVTASGNDITNSLNDRLLELRVEDHQGFKNDRLSITCDDRDPPIKLPNTGEILGCQMGYEDMPGITNPVSGMFDMGKFVLDEIKIGKKPKQGRTFTITAHAWNTYSALKQPRTSSYHEMTVKAIVDQIAKRNNMQAKVDPTLGAQMISHIDQRNESDASFLTRWGAQIGAKKKVQENFLLFGPPGTLKVLSGIILQAITMDETQMTEYDYLSQGRGRYTAIRGYYFDKDNGQRVQVQTPVTAPSTGEEEVYYTLNRTYPNKDAATRAVNSKKRELDNSECSLNFECVGNPQLLSETILTLTNFRPSIPNKWMLVRVTHTFSNGGYKTNADAIFNFKQGVATNATPPKSQFRPTPNQ